MQRVLVTACAIAAVLFLATSDARAEDVTGKIGIGADRSSAGASGASVRYGVIPKLDLEMILFFQSTSGENDTGSSRLDLAVLANYAVLEWPGLSLDVNGGVSIERTSNDDGVNDESDTDIGIEAGFGPHWWVTANLSFNLSVSLVIDLDDEGDGDNDDTTVTSVFGGPELVGLAGFTFWIR